MRRLVKTFGLAVITAIVLAGCLGPGTYQVSPTLEGGKAAVGLWHTFGGDGCYWERTSGFGGTIDEIIANNFSGGGPRYVEIKSGDVGFHTSGCLPWVQADGPLDKHPVLGASFGDGDYRAGVELAAGTYHASTPGDCYWERVTSFGGQFSDIVANDFGGGLVTVSPGDYGLSTSGCGTWTLVGQAPGGGGGTTNPPTQTGVTPGAFCTPVGAHGTTVTGVAMICATTDANGVPYAGGRARWHAA
jgi:hypothetical protein